MGGVVGVLAWAVKDPWTAREHVEKNKELLQQLALEQRRGAVSVTFDIALLGSNIPSTPRHPQSNRIGLRYAMHSFLRLAKMAERLNVPIELDSGPFEERQLFMRGARQVLEQTSVPFTAAMPANFPNTKRELRELVEIARGKGRKLGVRLLKGGYPNPDIPGVISRQPAMLNAYRDLIDFAFQIEKRNPGTLRLIVASHNPGILEHAFRRSKEWKVPFEIQMVEGLTPRLAENYRKKGIRITKYISMGKDTADYLVTDAMSQLKDRLREKGGNIRKRISRKRPNSNIPR